jgi:hypothetical protein
MAMALATATASLTRSCQGISVPSAAGLRPSRVLCHEHRRSKRFRKAAELVALSEQMRRDLRNGCTDPDRLLRFEGVASRAVRQLGLRVEPPPARARGLELARQRWAEEAEKAKKAKAVESAGEASAPHTTEPPDGRAA